jgi:AcrR family transcriptional regulator
VSETRERLLDAAERLFAEKGLHGTSAREIVATAGQRNESAIQYHFGGRKGLVEALVARRMETIEAARLERLAALFEAEEAPSVRSLLHCLVDPVVELCLRDPGFRAFLSAFGEAALAPGFALSRNRHELQSLDRMRECLEGRLDVPRTVLAARAEALTRFVLLNLSQWARSESAFQGRAFERFFTNLVDMAAAMLTAEVSGRTLAAHGES